MIYNKIKKELGKGNKKQIIEAILTLAEEIDEIKEVKEFCEDKE